MSHRSIKFWSMIIVAFFAVLVGFFGWQIRNFEIDASADTLLVEGDRNYLLNQQTYLRYQPEEFILIAYRPNSKNIFEHEVLTHVDEISKKIKDIERVIDVRSIVNSPIFVEMDTFSPDMDPNEFTWENKKFPAQSMRKNLGNHPLYEDLLINKDQSALSMQVVFKTPPKLKELNRKISQIQVSRLEKELTESSRDQLADLKEQAEPLEKELDEKRIEEIEQIRSILKPYQDNGEFYLGGNNLLAYQLITIIRNDLIVFGSAVALTVGIILLFLFRRFRWVALPLICCAISVTLTLGLLGWLGIKVTVISANVVALQIILSLAMIIHLIEQYREYASQDEDLNQVELVIKTIREKTKPCFFAGVTTAVGFGSLIFSGIQPVISFGWMMVMSMAITILVSLVLFPALLISFFQVSTRTKKLQTMEHLLHWIARFVEGHPRKIVTFWSIVFVLTLLGCLRLTAENSFINYFRESTDVHRELSYIDQNFGGSTPLDLLYTIPQSMRHPELIMTAETVTAVTNIQNMLEEIKGIGNITSVADFARIGQVVNEKPLTEYELTAFYRVVDKSLRQEVFGSYFSRDHHQVRISTRVQDATEGLNRTNLLESIHQGMSDLRVSDSHYQLTGLFILYQDVLARLVRSQVTTIGIVYLVMGLILFLVFRSIKVALIALAPNVVTTAFILGVIGYSGTPLDLMTITIAAVAMGISVDDTIHYIHRYLKENSVSKTHLSVGYALVYTTTVITLGFGSLIFSDFIPSVLFGAMTGLAMIIALITDMTLLPALLRRHCVYDQANVGKEVQSSKE